MSTVHSNERPTTDRIMSRFSHDHRNRWGCHRCGFKPRKWPNLEEESQDSKGGRPSGKRQTAEEHNLKRRLRRVGL